MEQYSICIALKVYSRRSVSLLELRMKRYLQSRCRQQWDMITLKIATTYSAVFSECLVWSITSSLSKEMLWTHLSQDSNRDFQGTSLSNRRFQSEWLREWNLNYNWNLPVLTSFQENHRFYFYADGKEWAALEQVRTRLKGMGSHIHRMRSDRGSCLLCNYVYCVDARILLCCFSSSEP